MTAPHCIKPASITITANIAACIGCLYVATVPAERRALGPHANNKPVHHSDGMVKGK
jgi:hypothetical protein